MRSAGSRTWSYALVGALGAVTGGAAVLLATKAIPRMMSRMMSEMMCSMATQMGEGDRSPAEI